jgi:hypothetical protein
MAKAHESRAMTPEEAGVKYTRVRVTSPALQDGRAARRSAAAQGPEVICFHRGSG